MFELWILMESFRTMFMSQPALNRLFIEGSGSFQALFAVREYPLPLLLRFLVLLIIRTSIVSIGRPRRF